MLTLTLRPHVERSGFHLDRFGAYVDGELVVVSRQPRRDGARKLLELGHDALLHVQHDGRPFDPTPQTIGELAKWTYYESDRSGIRKVLWRPYPERAHEGVAEASETASDALTGATVPGEAAAPPMLNPSEAMA